MKIFLGTWLLVQYFQCHALISDSQKCLIPCKGEMNVLNLTITCFDYVITNDDSQNKLQSFSPVSSSKLSQRPALTPNTVRSKLRVNKWFLSFALNITTCDARLKKAERDELRHRRNKWQEVLWFLSQLFLPIKLLCSFTSSSSRADHERRYYCPDKILFL